MRRRNVEDSLVPSGVACSRRAARGAVVVAGVDLPEPTRADAVRAGEDPSPPQPKPSSMNLNLAHHSHQAFRN
jgi:hypothetical protein